MRFEFSGLHAEIITRGIYYVMRPADQTYALYWSPYAQLGPVQVTY